MPVYVMAVIMLIIALASGLLSKSLEAYRIGSFLPFAFFTFSAVLGSAEIRISSEFLVNAGAFFVLAVFIALLAAKSKKLMLAILPVSALLAIPSAVIIRHSGADLAVLLCSLLPLASFLLNGGLPCALACAALTPALAACAAAAYSLAVSGFGVFALDRSVLDAQLMGTVFSVSFYEVRMLIMHKRAHSKRLVAARHS